MAYITTEAVKEMRNQLKQLYPLKQGWKFSVTREHYSSVRCCILQAPIELRQDANKEYESVNHFWLESHYKDFPAIQEVLKKVAGVLNQDNYNNSDLMTDYHDVGHYITLKVGDWDKPFTIKA
ncbi:LPD29 domain-containing protein [Flavobacterium sp. ABG]|uniref:LPD29 domain-containing protein n=1 Tax=Flavobacterium sp. ABG TaxID=1423322 RepID=UPI000649F0F5|nr:LPD29 domain-containing protein [Flavobacterium sp. ABG]KLT69906.1 hypothetical protein AB674_09380 [Flavobacterium sp. ABG]